MSKTNTHLYDFHFIIDERLKKQLLNQRFFSETTSFSGIVVRILQLLYPRLEKEHFFGKERMSRYQLVAADLTLKRCSVHVYLPRDLYRRLKLIHQDLNFYSIAQFIRWMLQLFLKLVASNSINLRQKLDTLLIHCQRQIAAARLPLKIVRQLSSFMKCGIDKLRLMSIYDSNFSSMMVLHC